MNLFSKKNIKTLLKKYKTKPLKRLGQNFLIDKGVAKRVIKTAELKPDDTVLEIGPGIGTLTQEIARWVKKIIAIEKDPKMIEILKETLKDFDNVKIIQGDILKLNPVKSRALNLVECSGAKQFNKVNPKPYTLNPYKVVANLPFYLTAPIIRKFLESKNPPEKMVLIIQKEVGQRICAKPPKMSILAVSVQFYAQPKIISYISKKSFWPQPKVDSAIIKIVPHRVAPHQYLRYGGGLREQFFNLVRSGFSQPRKQLTNNLTKNLKIDKIKIEQWLIKNKIQPAQRAETLSVKDWLKLTETF